MSNYLAIATVTAALKQVLQVAASAAVDDANVTTQRPDGATGNAVRDPEVNLFLYEVAPNAHWRNTDLPARRPDGSAALRPVTAVDLRYLMTFYGDESDLEPQRLMGAVLSGLGGHPVLTASDIDRVVSPASEQFVDYLETSNLGDQIEAVRLTPLSLDLEAMSKLWSVFFQTPYALSTAYQASVALMQSDVRTRPSLPVRGRLVYGTTFRQPRIDRVGSDDGSDAIVVGGTLAIAGRQLRGEVTSASWDGVEVTPTSIEDTCVTVSLAVPPVPAAQLRAGVHGVQIVHSRLMGEPPTPHRGVGSNVAAFILRPTITAPVAIGAVTVEDGLRSGNVTVQVAPEIGQGQIVVLLLNELASTEPAAYAFDLIPPDADTNSVTFAVSGVAAGNYLVRVQVDGAESPLEVGADPSDPVYTGPSVTVP